MLRPQDYEQVGQPWHLLINLTTISGTARDIVIPQATHRDPNQFTSGYGIVITGIHYNMRGTAGNGFTLQAVDNINIATPGGAGTTYPIYSATCAAATVSTTQSLSGLWIPLAKGTYTNSTPLRGAKLQIVQIAGLPTSGHVLVTGLHTGYDFGDLPYLPTPGSPSVIF